VIYLDTSALVKLARQEPGSTDLVSWLGQRPQAALIASVLVEVELPRALRRHAPEALPGVPGLLARLYLLEIDATMRSTAAAFPDPRLRSLDAVHLATAHLAGSQTDPLQAFIAYDDRLLLAAAASGLPVASPGRGGVA
jgi:predicted nucleic acid-binding protein